MFKKTPAWHQREDLFIVPGGGWVLAGTLMLAVVLAGGRPLWAQGVVTIGIGLLWLFWPPRKLPPPPMCWAALVLALAPLLAYMPWSWFPELGWRMDLLGYPAITASAHMTPQPWLTFQVWLLWMTGLSLAFWCATQAWDRYHQCTMAKLLAAILIAIVAYALYARAAGSSPSVWQSPTGFGPFINRNQWGALMALCALLCLGLIHQSVRQESKQGILFWILGFVLMVYGILVNLSRGAVVMLIFGGFAYWLIFALAMRKYRYAGIALSFALISFAVFAFGGGALLERFMTFEPGEDAFTNDARVQFFRMARRLIADAPLTGFGLGNFEYVFPFYLDYEPLMNRRPLHPESSWLWLGSEGGWTLVLSVVAALVVVCTYSFRALKSRYRPIRTAALACAFAAAVSSLFEVNGHRIGLLFPAILMASLALPAAAEGVVATGRIQAWRVVGLLLVMVGAVWAATGLGVALAPPVQGIAALRARADEAREAGRMTELLSLLGRSEQLLPYDWRLHWELASHLAEAGEEGRAWNEFRAAGALVPYAAQTVQNEAAFWMKKDPLRSAYAWQQAILRTPQGRRPGLYASSLKASAPRPDLRAMLLRLYPDDPEFELVRIRSMGLEGTDLLPRLLAKTQNLGDAPDQLVEPVLRYLLENQRGELLDSLTARSPRMRRLGWRVLADQAVNAGRLDEALSLTLQFGPKPVLPAPISRSDLRSIERAAALAPLDIATAISYYQALEAARRKEDAYMQLKRIMEFPNAPAYVWYLGAMAANERGEHADAWQFLKTFEKKTNEQR